MRGNVTRTQLEVHAHGTAACRRLLGERVSFSRSGGDAVALPTRTRGSQALASDPESARSPRKQRFNGQKGQTPHRMGASGKDNNQEPLQVERTMVGVSMLSLPLSLQPPLPTHHRTGVVLLSLMGPRDLRTRSLAW